MEDRLDDFFRENRDAFNEEEPRHGHEDRFRMKLDNRHGRRRRSMVFSPMMRVAATILFGFLLGYFYYWADPAAADKAGLEAGVTEASVDLSAISPELSEAEFFFDNMLKEKMVKVQEMKNEDTASFAGFMENLKNLEADYTDLKQELQHNETNERIINAMVENYRLRLDILEHFANQVNKAKEFKTAQQNEEHPEI